MDLYNRLNLFVLFIAGWTVCTSSFKINFWKRAFHVDRSIEDNSVHSDKVFFKKGTLEGRVTEVIRGESIVLECEAGGSPTPTVHWLHKGSRIVQGLQENILDDEAVYESRDVLNSGADMLRLGYTKSRLYLDCISSKDKGDYTCVAEIPSKRIAKTTHLKIDHSKSSDHSSTCNTKVVPARVYMWTSHRLELEGTDVQLYCRASGSGATKVEWIDNKDVPIESNEEYTLLPNGDLLIRNISWKRHMGNFRCKATDEETATSDEESTFLYPTTP